MIWGRFERTWRSASRAKAVSGYPVSRQFMEMAAGALSGRKLTPSEYIDYRLFDSGMRDPRIRNGFVGYQRVMALNLALNDLRWGAVSFDKLSFYAICDAISVPRPQLRAIYSALGRPSQDAEVLREEADIVAFLRHRSFFPLFCKPVQGTHGHGTALIRGYDHDKDRVLLEGLPPTPVSEFARQLRLYERTGYLFQEMVQQHPDLERVASGGVSGLRLVVLIEESGPRLIHAVWKIKRTHQLTDHFSAGTTGNLLADVDPDTGQVRRIVSGIGHEQTLVLDHPDTGARLQGSLLPSWESVLDTILRAAVAFPGIRLQSWDLAITPEGPMVFELNYDGDMNLIQVATGRGVLGGPIGRALLKHTTWGRLARQAL